MSKGARLGKALSAVGVAAMGASGISSASSGIHSMESAFLLGGFILSLVGTFLTIYNKENKT